MKIESNKFKNYLLLSVSFKEEGEYHKALDMLDKARHFAVSEEQIIDIEFEVADVYTHGGFFCCYELLQENILNG